MVAKASGTRTRAKAASGPATPAADAGTPGDDRIVLMVIDGIECTVNPDVPFHTVLRYMDDVIGMRLSFGQLRLVKTALTDDAYQELLSSKIERHEWQELANKVVTHLFSAPEKEAEQGN